MLSPSERDTDDEVDIKKMCAVELSDYCVDLYEKILKEKQHPLKRILIRKYNEAAFYFNTEVVKFKSFLLC